MENSIFWRDVEGESLVVVESELQAITSACKNG